MNTNPDDSVCARCGASEHATHHSLCQDRDGTPTGLSDNEVREGIRLRNEYEIVLRYQDNTRRNSCAVCNVSDRMNAPLTASLEGTDKWVCLGCLEARWGLPELARLIDYINAAVTLKGSAEDKLEEILRDIRHAKRSGDVDDRFPF